MYCQQCRLHFTGQSGESRCPYCGQAAGEDSLPPRSPSENGIVAPPGVPAQATGTELEETLTEKPRPEIWAPGTVLAGKYEVLLHLGAGGFGSVYKVRHVFRKKYYALKTPHLEFIGNEAFRRRFEREIEAMERFVHPDAVMIRDSGMTDEGRPYYTMDFIEGESLKGVLEREVRLPLDRALRVVTRVLKVLEVAHSHRIIHRDIKPDNVLLTRVNGREAVKVLDFGVAKLLDLVGDSGSITHGERVGTPKYMSPEQITGEPVDERSDLFSLGIVFYEMVTGRHPFTQVRDPIRVTASILNRDPLPPREIVPELPRQLNDHILSMLEKKVKRRPPSASVLLKQLQALSEGVSRIELADRLTIQPGPPRSRAATLLLRQETSAGQRRCFLLFDEKVSLGRSNDPQKGILNQILLRCLPCRSQAQDPENWQKNLTISHTVGTVYPEGTALMIEPSPDAKHGVAIGGVKSHRAARIQTDRFHMAVGDRVLELDGYRLLRGAEGPDFDLSFLAEGRPASLEPQALIGYSNRACQIDAVSFFRVNNWPLHEYYLIYRILKIGCSPHCPLRLRGKGVEGTHAAILSEGGEAFLLAFEEGVRIVGLKPEGAEKLEEELEPVELPPWRLLPLGQGMEIILGENHLYLDAASDAHFKSV
jgi:serine/threonine protein kinase